MNARVSIFEMLLVSAALAGVLFTLLTLFTTLVPFAGVVFAGDPNADKLERIPTPAESLAALSTAEGYEVNLFASEETAPLYNPMSMAFDAEGRLWVITSPTYPHYDPGVKPTDKILIFEDTTGDGVADKHIVFADELYIPTGIAPDVNGGCWVGAQPNLWYLQDTDGDLVADRRELVLHGFGTEDSHHSLSAFTWGPDGAFYFNEGVFHHSQVETPYGPVRAVDAAVFRFKPSTHRLTVASHRWYANPWGHAFDRWGQSVLSDASGGDHYAFAQVIPAFDYPQKIVAPKPLLNRGRPMAGNLILSSRHFPDDVQGTHLNNQSIGFHGTRWDRLTPHGSAWKTEKLPDLLTSSDFAFRPVAVEVGADGALYVLDYCNRRLGHMQYSHRDPDRDHSHGRIWRISAKDRPFLEKKSIVGATVPELLDRLTEHENHVRHFARRELQTRPSAEVEPALAAWVAANRGDDPESEHRRLEALWVYEGRNRHQPPLLRELLDAKHPLARAAATRVLRHWLEDRKFDDQDALELLAPRVEDDDQRVRLEAVVACGFVRNAEASALALLASDLPMDANFGKVLEQTLKVLKKYGDPPAEVGRRFQLSRLPAEELRAQDLDEVVARVWLGRADLDVASHQRAIEFLAERSSQSAAEIIVVEIERRDGLGRDVSALLARLEAQPTESLTPHLPQITALARGSKRSSVREATTAVALRAEGSIDAVAAGGVPLVQVLASVPRVTDPGVLAALYPSVAEQFAAARLEVQRAAMRSAVQLAAHREVAFASLAKIVDTDSSRRSVVAKMAMNEVPHTDWPTGFDAYRLEPVDPDAVARGREVYHREGLCVTCHQPDGYGVLGSYPPLVATPRVLGSEKSLARIVLHGLQGPIQVNGQRYRSAMAPLANVLSDAEIADVLTYVRNEWGNRASAVSTELVADLRRTDRRNIAWTASELATEELNEQVTPAPGLSKAPDVVSSTTSYGDPHDGEGTSLLAKVVVFGGGGIAVLTLLYMAFTVVTMKTTEE